ncbi:YkvA family protein [Actinoplanes sp. NPDC049802]|uniref:YkvA family protein n=1 Tax=Actinoplanes sp. NPDC049802 TaxID=3154742 RepID=UPI0033E1CBBC
MAKTLKRAAAFAALARALTAGNRGGPSIAQRLGALPRMIVATARGQYDGGLRLALMVAATAYVVSPVDAVPELIVPLLGLVDDAFAVTWLAGTILSETERFLEWERTRARLVVE